MTERVIREIVPVLYGVYDEYRLSWLPPDIIQFGRQLRMAMRPFLKAI